MLIRLIKLIIAHKKLSFILLMIVGLGLTAYYFNETKEPANTLTIDPKKTFADLEPGKSTHDEIIGTLGVPQRVYEEDGYMVYTYPSTTSYYMPDLLYLKNERLQMKELNYSPRQFKFTKEKLVKQYGSPTKILYLAGENYADYEVYVFEKTGIAAYLDGADKVFKLRTFKPISAEDYITTWDKSLLLTKPKLQPEKHY